MTDQQEDYIKKLQAENAAMREALREAADFIVFGDQAEAYGEDILQKVKDLTGYDPALDAKP